MGVFSLMTACAGFILSVTLVSAIAIPNPFQSVHGTPLTTGNSLLSPFTRTSSSSFSSTYQPTTHIFPQLNHAATAFHTTTPLIESNISERFELIPGKGLTPTMSYLLPTGKCPVHFYCRAEMSIYKEFSGTTAISVGYSIWNFIDPNAAVPMGVIDMIMATTVPEIRRYLMLLTHSTYPDYPFRDQLCRYDFDYAVEEFQKAITEMSECKFLYDGVCRKTEVVQRC